MITISWTMCLIDGMKTGKRFVGQSKTQREREREREMDRIREKG
jgi:hypothetical protein